MAFIKHFLTAIKMADPLINQKLRTKKKTSDSALPKDIEHAAPHGYILAHFCSKFSIALRF